MKPIASHFTPRILCVVALLLTICTGAKAQDSFRDVPSGHWAYRVITDFQKNEILAGYPDGFFSGKRILTRYEFALAIKRALDNVIPQNGNKPGKISRPAVDSLFHMVSLEQVQSFKRLVEEFSKDLTLIDVNVSALKVRLNEVSGRYHTGSARLEPAPKAAIDLFHGVQISTPRSVFTGNAGTDFLTVNVGSGQALNGFNVTARIGIATASLFANGNQTSPSAITGNIFDRSTVAPVGSPLAIAPLIPDGFVSPITQSSVVPTRAAGLHVSVPLGSSGTVVGALIDISNGPGASQASNDVIVGDFNFRLNPIGRVRVSGEASKSVGQLDTSRADGQSVGDNDNDAFNLNIRYDSGPLGVLGGFQYIDPGYEAPDAWNRIGVFSSLTNVQGPYLRVNYALNQRTQFQLGSDLLAGAKNRSYNFGGGLITGFGTHDYISTVSAGMRYKLWHSASLMADWQGVYWDLSAASSGLGVEAHPFESYINLGTGISLPGNATLKMGYQIGSFGNFSGFGGLGPSGSGQTYNAFTTQLNVKF